MTRSLALAAPAKINLYLRVERRRADGYHDLATVFHAIDLADELHLAERGRARAGVPPAALRLEGPPWARDLPVGPHNLVLRADALMRRHHPDLPAVDYTLVKRVPPQSGLGGGSADAAAVLVGLDAAFDLGHTPAELAGLAAGLGSDTSFCVLGGCAVGRGRGERLQPVASRLDAHVLLARPPLGIPTPAAFAACTPLGEDEAALAAMLAAVGEGDLDAVVARLSNSFDTPRLPGHAVLSALRDRFVAAGFATVALSGSGSALFALVPSAEDAERGRRALAAEDLWTATARLCPHGPVALPVGTSPDSSP